MLENSNIHDYHIGSRSGACFRSLSRRDGAGKTSTRRRICFVNDVPRQMELLLNTVWEIRNLTHLGLHGFSGASKRLSKVHFKLQALWWLADETDAVVMLDTNLYIKRSLDGAFSKLTHSKVAGAIRGINGGVVVFRLNREEARAMLVELKTYPPPDFVGGEQEFLMKYFGLEQQIASLDLAMNYQVHHFALRAAHDSDGGPWVSLAQQSDQIRCFFSQQYQGQVIYY